MAKTLYIMRMKHTVFVLAFMIIVSTACLFAAGTSENPEDLYRVGVFVPGVVDGSPTYEMMVRGVRRASSEAGGGVDVAVVEGGFDQSTWQEGVMSMAVSGAYDLIVTSNPSMPEIVEAVTEAVPEVRFIVLDGYLSGNPRIHTVLFNQREQAFLAGYFAGLVTQSALPRANPDQRAGLLAGQEYPIMNDTILPGFRLGFRTILPEGEVDFRVLGNWFDAGKAQEIATDMIGRGSDVILTIAGGGNQGVIAAARERGAYVLWYDDSGYDQAPGLVIGSSFVRQDDAAYEATRAAIDGTLAFGEARILGVADGAVSFDTEDPSFIRAVPEPIREEMEAILERLRSGNLLLEMNVPAR